MMALFVDWVVNQHSMRVRLLLIGYRLTSLLYGYSRWMVLFLFPIFISYRIYEVILGCELSWKVRCGERLQIFHVVGLVINPATQIGSDCILRHATTLGARRGANDAPTIGDRVDIGCNVVVLGAVSIGSGAAIGAGAVVLKDVPENGVVVGNPARLLVS